jgi:imidazole glycerol phosphate synthase subunit HisF
MKAQMKRRIVIEVERVQLIRKRAKTFWAHCPVCNIDSDFVSIETASRLFEMTSDELAGVLKTISCHYREDSHGKGDICLNSFLSPMNVRKSVHRIKQIP